MRQYRFKQMLQTHVNGLTKKAVGTTSMKIWLLQLRCRQAMEYLAWVLSNRIYHRQTDNDATDPATYKSADPGCAARFCLLEVLTLMDHYSD